MRALCTALVVSFLTAAPAAAEEMISYNEGTIRLKGGTRWAKKRSMWARGKSLVLVMPGKDLKSKVIKTGEALLKEIRLSGYNNRTELELRLSENSMNLLQRVDIKNEGQDLLIRIAPEVVPPPAATAPALAAGTAPSKPAAAPAAAAASPPAPFLGKKAKKAKEKISAKTLGLKQTSAGTSSIWLLLVVISVAGGAAWWLRRRKQQTPLDETHIDVVSTRALSGKHRLVMVEAAGELLLLGCTDKDIRLLRAVDRNKLQQNQEDEFFAEGIRIDADNASITDSAPEPAAEPAAPDALNHNVNKARASSFMKRLNQQIRSRQASEERVEISEAAQQPTNSAEDSPLDEKWAQGIINLRRARRFNGSSSTGMLH